MNWFLTISAVLLAVVWTVHLVQAAFGVPSIPVLTGNEWDISPEAIARVSGRLPRVTVIVAARNEEAKIEEALRSLVALDYPNLEVIGVDDRSTDATGKLMDGLAGESAGRLRVVHVSALPAGWLGKTHAMWAAAKQSTGDWILFTDADVIFRVDSLRRAVAYLETERADHLVLFPTMITHSWDEQMMIGFFQAMFVFGHRPWKVSDAKARDYIGVGAFNMVRRSVYEKLGTYERLKLAVIDDMRLGELVKKGGFAQRTAFGNNLIRIHWAAGAMGVVRGLTKNFFAFMRFNAFFAVSAAAAVLFLNLMPFVGMVFAHGWQRALFGVAVAGIALLYAGFSSRSEIPAYMFFLHPVSACLFSYTILRSTFVTLAQGGIVWRDTKYGLKELRQGMD